MTSIDELKATVQSEIDRRGDELIGAAKKILANPEPGFREKKTSQIVAQAFERMGIDPAVASGPMVTTFSDITGILVYFGLAALMIDWLVR